LSGRRSFGYLNRRVDFMSAKGDHQWKD